MTHVGRPTHMPSTSRWPPIEMFVTEMIRQLCDAPVGVSTSSLEFLNQLCEPASCCLRVGMPGTKDAFKIGQ